MKRIVQSRSNRKSEHSDHHVWCASSGFRVSFAAPVAILFLLTTQLVATAEVQNIIRVPLMRQATDFTCGIAALQAVLAYYGEDVREDVLSKSLHANHKNGTRYKNIADYAEAHGLSVHIQKNMALEDLRNAIAAGNPVICLIQAWADKLPDKEIDYASDWNDGHYVVAVGFDKDKIIFMDPSTAGHYAYIPLQDFEKRWHDIDGKERLNHFGMRFSKNGSNFDSDKVLPLE